MSSVKKIGKSRKTKTAKSKTAKTKTAKSKSRHAGVKAAKRAAPKARKARASLAHTGRSSAPAKRMGSAKTKARKPARANSKSGRNAATGSRAATLARLKKAGTRTAPSSAKGRMKLAAQQGKSRSGRQGAAQSKLPKSAAGASRQPASREATAQKLLSERRAHAEAVMKLRATTGKPQPRGSNSAAQKLQKRAPPAAPHPRPGAPTRSGVPAAGPVSPATAPAFEARPGEIRLPGGPGIKPIVKPMGGVKLGFKPAEFIVYPAHGVGQIIAIEEQEVAGFKLELFVISFAKDKMILKVPTPKTVSVGMRKLASAEVVKQALNTLTGRARIKRTMWSRRAQEYEAKINSGDLVAIAEVVRDLYRSEAQPEQSYSERQLYEAALDRVAREIAVVQKLTETESLKLIESQLQKGPRRIKGEEAEAEADPVAPEAEGVDEAA
jgi:CarD family transcriptional regulator